MEGAARVRLSPGVLQCDHIHHSARRSHDIGSDSALVRRVLNSPSAYNTALRSFHPRKTSPANAATSMLSSPPPTELLKAVVRAPRSLAFGTDSRKKNAAVAVPEARFDSRFGSGDESAAATAAPMLCSSGPPITIRAATIPARNGIVKASFAFRPGAEERCGAKFGFDRSDDGGSGAVMGRTESWMRGVERGGKGLAVVDRIPGNALGLLGLDSEFENFCSPEGIQSGRRVKCRCASNYGTFMRRKDLSYLSWRIRSVYSGARLPALKKGARFAAGDGASSSSDLEESPYLRTEEGSDSESISASPPSHSNVKYIGLDCSSEPNGSSTSPVSSGELEPVSAGEGNGDGLLESRDRQDEFRENKFRPKPYKNRLLGFFKVGTIINDAAESFFKSEIRRRVFVTVTLMMASRLGYFIPIPGFDRRFMPGDYLALVSGAVEELGDLVSELKLAVFQLGISPYIFSSIVMQVASHLVPKLAKLRKEGLDGNEMLKKYTWWLALVIAIVESLVVSFHSAQYSVYGARNSFSYVVVTSGLLTTGAMMINWICEKITVAGFGQGSSLIICISILTGYSENLYKMISNLLRGTTTWVPLGLFLGCFFLITMWAVIVTEGRRKVKLQYFDFELASGAGGSSALPEVEPYIPFNINPTGMQPVLTTTYLMALPSLVAGLTGNRAWISIRDTLNPAYPTAPGAKPWLYYSLNAMFIFIFNVLDIMDTPKEVADYMMKIGARIPSIKPGRRTIEYLTKVQASTRFWGGLLLALLATVSTLVDYRFRYLHQGGTIGFTSMLIIVGSIVELRRSFLAYNVMPSLSKVLKRYGV